MQIERLLRGIGRTLSLLLGMSALLASGAAQRLTWLGPVEVRGVANNGLVIGKATNDSGGVRTLRATRLQGSELNGTLGGNHSEAWSITGNGLTLVGFSTMPNGAVRAYRQLPTGGLQNLGTLAGNTGETYYWSEARDVSADGNTVVGRSIDAGGRLRAFRWTPSEGMQDLGALGGLVSSAYGVSANGAVVVGWSSDPQGRTRPFRWSASDGMQDLGTFGGSTGDAWATSADGSVVVGAAHNAQGQWRAFRWTQQTGLQPLGTLGGTESGARDISANGAIIVGLARNAQGQWRAFRWTAAGGMEDLTQRYAHLMHNGSYLEVAQSISPNGRYIVGQGYNAATQRAEAFLLETEPPRPGRIRFIQENAGIAPLAAAISWDGRVVVGVTNTTPAGRYRYFADYGSSLPSLTEADAFRWTPTGGLQILARLAAALDVSPDGTNIVGGYRCNSTGDHLCAFRWTEQGGLEPYPHIQPFGDRDPRCLSGVSRLDLDVAMVTGDSVPPYHRAPAIGVTLGTFNSCNSYVSYLSLSLYWYDTQARPGNPYFAFPSFPERFVIPTDTDIATAGDFCGYEVTSGAVYPVVGLLRLPTCFGPGVAWSRAYTAPITVGSSGPFAVRWVPEAFGVVRCDALGTLPNRGNSSYAAFGVSDNSAVIVGALHSSYTYFAYAFRWTDENGMEDLNDSYGHLLEGTNYQFAEAKATSYDGRYIVGFVQTVQYGYPTVPTALYWLDTWREGDTNGDGCVDDADLLAVLFNFGGRGTAPTYHEDINLDGIVDDADLLTVLFNFGSGC